MTERTLSCFFVKELLPLYIEDKLDTKRRSEIKNHLSTCRQCHQYYEKLAKAREALLELSKTKVSPLIIDFVKEEHTVWSEVYKKIKWNKWPYALKWGTELILVSLLLVITIHLFPWLRFVQVVKNLQPQAPVVAQVKPPPETAPIVEPSPWPVLAESKATPVSSPKTTTEVVAKAAPEPKKVEVTETAPPEEESATGASEADEASPATAKKQQGYVWRGTLQVDEVSDELVTRVTTTITELGGTKAGEVELGWHRGNQRYYHFILPEDNYEKLLSVLNSEGLVELKKERHPRVMKNGYMRIIMTIEESKE